MAPIQIETIAADEQVVYQAATELYNELVARGYDEEDAAWEAAQEYGLVHNGNERRRDTPRSRAHSDLLAWEMNRPPHRRDPLFKVDWDALARGAKSEHPRYDAEGPSVQ